ncbi:MAG: TAXI family TRAP transporter solute-binding subunit [Synergistaceae bacterium]|nr:TAXI family TRAP transporter solute-binding subunit [Synergistaceae bacterium]
MKKSIRGILSLGAAFVLAAPPAFAAQFVNIGTGPTGGTYYPVGAGIAKIWNGNVQNMKASAQSTGGTRNNIQLMESGEAQVIFADGIHYDAYNGRDSYKGAPKKFMRAMVPLYPEAIHIVARKGSGIKTLADLKGKRVSVGAVGGSVEVTSDSLFKCAGIDPADIKKDHLGHSESVAALQDNQIDAAITVGAIGISSVVEPMTLGIVELIDVPAPVVEKMIKNTPYFAPLTIPAGSYKGQTRDVKTFSSPNILAVEEKMDEETVYEMTKTLFQHKNDLVVISARMSAMDPSFVKDIKIPLHPGALKYYREIGAVK